MCVLHCIGLDTSRCPYMSFQFTQNYYCPPHSIERREAIHSYDIPIRVNELCWKTQYLSTVCTTTLIGVNTQQFVLNIESNIYCSLSVSNHQSIYLNIFHSILFTSGSHSSICSALQFHCPTTNEKTHKNIRSLNSSRAEMVQKSVVHHKRNNEHRSFLFGSAFIS